MRRRAAPTGPIRPSGSCARSASRRSRTVGPLVFYGDGRAFATALDARTGKQLWSTAIDDHALAKVTAAPERLRRPRLRPDVDDRGSAPARARLSLLHFEWERLGPRREDGKAPLEAVHRARRAEAREDQPGEGAEAVRAGGRRRLLAADGRSPTRAAVYAATAASYDDGYWPDAQSIVAYDCMTGERRWATHVQDARSRRGLSEIRDRERLPQQLRLRGAGRARRRFRTESRS